MEKFVLVIGDYNKNQITNSAHLLKRREDEDIKYIYRDNYAFASVNNSNITHIDKAYKDIIIIGELEDYDSSIEYIKDLISKNDISGEAIHFDFKGDVIVLILDKIDKNYKIIVEPWFRRLVYYSYNWKKIIVSSEIKGIMGVDNAITDDLDEIGIESFIALNAVYGNRTLFKNIRIFNSGSIYNLMDNSWEQIGRYDYPDDYNYNLNFDKQADKIADLFRNKVNTLVEDGYHGLFLSGGLDSRLVLIAIDEENRSKITAVHIGNMNNSDSLMAKNLAVKADVEFYLHESNSDAILKYIETQVWATEGALFMGTSIIAEAVNMNPNIKYMDGNPGDLTLGGTWANKLSKYKVDAKNKYYKDGLILGEPIGKSSVKEKLIIELFGETKGRTALYNIYNLIQEDISAYSFVKHQTLALEYYALHNRVRRAVPHIISEYADFNRPFMDDDISRECIIVPIEIRKDREFQIKVMRVLNKELTDLLSTSVILVKKSRSLKEQLYIFSKSIIKKIPVISKLARKLIYSKIAKSKQDTYMPLNEWFHNNSEYQNFIVNNIESFKKRKILLDVSLDKLLKEQQLKLHDHSKTLANIVNLELILKMFKDNKSNQ